jgi:[acyl-carrier-protein] S-malonyltransferase
VLALVAPGQGAQTPGFLSPWLDLPGVPDLLEWWSAVAGLDLTHYGTRADEAEIRDTAIAQPLLVASGLIGALSLFPHPSDAFPVVGLAAGHSVGEITAAAGARAITAESAMVLVRERGRAMAEASARIATGMTAVLGGERSEVLAAIETHGLTAANENGGGQIVAAGTLEQLAAFAAAPPAGARLRPLSVAGAFHTHHMGPAVERMEQLARSVTVRDPRTRLLSNRDGAVIHHGREALTRIVGQVARPVRWDLCMRSMIDLGVTAVIEVPPAGTLVGLIKRSMPGVETLALKSPSDLEAARDLVRRHGLPEELENQPAWRLLVASASGIFNPGANDLGDDLPAGGIVATIKTRQEELNVVAPHGGTIIEWLAEPGDPVAPGQPLVRLHPSGDAQ